MRKKKKTNYNVVQTLQDPIMASIIYLSMLFNLLGRREKCFGGT